MTYSKRSFDHNNLHLTAHTCNISTTGTCHCTALKRTSSIKYLGVVIDDKLDFQLHIEALTNRTRKLIFIFRNLRHVADIKLIKTVYYALCQSVFTYCITSWGGAAKSHLLKLERAQRAILKVSLFLPFRHPSYDL